MIRFGDAGSIPALKKLWKECFGDEDAYIHAFFKALYHDADVVLAEENGVLLGASFFLPGKIYLQGRAQGGQGQCGGYTSVRYVYALAVSPQYRGRGIASKLLIFAHQAYGAPLIAEPAEDGLVGGFYRPLGFLPSFYLEKEETDFTQYGIQAAGIGSVQQGQALGGAMQYFAATAGQYCALRDAHFCRHGYVSWPVGHVAFALQEHLENGGGAFVIRKIPADGSLQKDSAKKEDILLYYMEGSKAVVTETTLTQQEAIAFFQEPGQGPCRSVLLKKRIDDNRVPCIEKGQAGFQGSQDGAYLIGMSYGLPPVYGYLNLSLD